MSKWASLKPLLTCLSNYFPFMPTTHHTLTDSSGNLSNFPTAFFRVISSGEYGRALVLVVEFSLFFSPPPV